MSRWSAAVLATGGAGGGAGAGCGGDGRARWRFRGRRCRRWRRRGLWRGGTRRRGLCRRRRRRGRLRRGTKRSPEGGFGLREPPPFRLRKLEQIDGFPRVANRVGGLSVPPHLFHVLQLANRRLEGVGADGVTAERRRRVAFGVHSRARGRQRAVQDRLQAGIALAQLESGRRGREPGLPIAAAELLTRLIAELRQLLFGCSRFWSRRWRGRRRGRRSLDRRRRRRRDSGRSVPARRWWSAPERVRARARFLFPVSTDRGGTRSTRRAGARTARRPRCRDSAGWAA